VLGGAIRRLLFVVISAALRLRIGLPHDPSSFVLAGASSKALASIDALGVETEAAIVILLLPALPDERFRFA
jgi:hypothetical protein